eukprot:g14866.t1
MSSAVAPSASSSSAAKGLPQMWERMGHHSLPQKEEEGPPQGMQLSQDSVWLDLDVNADNQLSREELEPGVTAND